MATMKTLNGYVFNATEFNGKTSDSYLLKTDTAADSAKLGGKAPEYYLQPRNLLDNSDFIHPVNQRAITSADVSAWTYFIDRWKVEDDTLTISVETDGIHLTASSRAWFSQWLQMSDSDVGKAFTLACGLSDGSIIVASGTMPDNVSVWTEFITGSNDAVRIRSAYIDNRKITVGINPKSNIVLKWAALYEGSYTADTLPPYVPKGYAAELAECQRYYHVYKRYYTCGFVSGSAKNYYMTVNINSPMRCMPSVTLESYVARKHDGYSARTGSNGVAPEKLSLYASSAYESGHIVIIDTITKAVDANNINFSMQLDNLHLNADL